MILRIVYISVFSVVTFFATAQSELAALQERFRHYTTQHWQEKLFVHTDKRVYATGELMWFKIYAVDGMLHRLLNTSKIAYVEVIAADNRPVLQAKIALDTGKGNGSFIIPSSLRSGRYLLRAYTNWMKNFDPSFFFEMPLTIIDPDKRPLTTNTQKINDPVISFFPEGGHLVNGLTSTLAVAVRDQYGSPLPAEGEIRSGGRSVSRIITDRSGTGSVSFTPQKGERYESVWNVNGRTITAVLPAIQEQGWVMQLKENANELQITVRSNVPAAQQLYLLAHNRQVLQAAQQRSIQNGEAVFLIPKQQLKEGVTHFTVFNDQRQPVTERLFFRRPASIVVSSISHVQEQGTRKKIDVSMNALLNGVPLNAADLSVSVFRTDAWEEMNDNDIVTYLLLRSDLPNINADISSSIRGTDEHSSSALDNIMLTQGWRRFNWSEVLRADAPAFSFLPELEGHIIAGTVSKNGIAPVRPVTAFLSVPGYAFEFVNTVSDAEGKLHFNVPLFYGAREMVVQTDAKSDSGHRIEIISPFSDRYSQRELSPMPLNDAAIKAYAFRIATGRAQYLYRPERLQEFTPPSYLDTMPFFGKPDITYWLDDYTRFPTMEEVLREYVKQVDVRKREDGFHFEVFDRTNGRRFPRDPLVLIDGVPIFNMDKAIALDPLKIKKIDIAAHAHYVGTVPMYGVVSFSTYEGDLNGFEFDPAAIVLPYDGLQLQREFYSPGYATPEQFNDRVPDLRNVLYWSPSLRLHSGKAGFSFFSSDVPGNYKICVQGLTAEGQPVSAASSFTIK